MENVEQENDKKPNFFKSLLVMIVLVVVVYATTVSLNNRGNINNSASLSSENSSARPDLVAAEKRWKLKEEQLNVEMIHYKCSIVINNIDELTLRARRYILDTNDTEPSIEKINNHFNITHKWINYHGESLNLDTSSPDGLVITNIFSTGEEITSLTREIFRNHPLLYRTDTISEDFSKIKIPYDSQMLEFIKKHNNRDSEGK